jgi:hypothetical protein
MAEHSHEPTGYQLCLSVGTPPDVLSGTRIITLAPPTVDNDAVLAALVAAPLSPADLRARTLVYFDPTTTPSLAILVYTALSGYAGRHLDILAGETLIAPASLLRAATALHSERPASQVAVVQVGATHEQISSILLDHPITTEEAVRIRWARRVRFVPDVDLVSALSQFIVISALRTRATTERLPYLCTGSEPFNEEAPLDLVGSDLDALRLAALAHRRSERSGDRDSLVEVLSPSARDERLSAAADVPIEEALARLGARQNPDTDLWHCPRPSRHTHGDATASMRIQNGKVRCYRCDGERVDALRLTMDVTGLSPDESADWLLSPTGSPYPAATA